MTASLDQEQIERGEKLGLRNWWSRGPLEPKERSISKRNGGWARESAQRNSTDTPTDWATDWKGANQREGMAGKVSKANWGQDKQP